MDFDNIPAGELESARAKIAALLYVFVVGLSVSGTDTGGNGSVLHGKGGLAGLCRFQENHLSQGGELLCGVVG